MNIISDLEIGKITIHKEFDTLSEIGKNDATPYLNNIGDEYIININNLENIISFDSFSYDTLGMNAERYLFQYFRISENGTSWSDWFELNPVIDNFPKVDPSRELHIEIKWVRQGISDIGSIRILDYKLEGKLNRNTQFLGSRINLMPLEKKVIMSPFIFKVFKIVDIEIIPDTGLSDIDIKYRYSQDNTRTWSNWEPFTKENITTLRINPIRFFQIEYLLENKSNRPLFLNDINLIGDFQNVNNDYQKSNLFGIRECCSSNEHGYFDRDGNYHPNTTLNSSSGGGETCDYDTFAPMSDDEKANLYNPYAQNTATKLLEKLSEGAEQMLGHKVNYFLTDPDEKGQDHTLNEYQLYNVVCEGDLKISIDGNNFPDSQIKMNIFDLDLFDTMEAHVTKRQFKQMFGPQRRPSKEDFLYFCQVNRMYQVDHAQQFRSFNNSAVYYKLILKKYNKKSNVIPDTPQMSERLDQLTNNSTIDQLFGIERSDDKKSVANKPQTAPLTRELIRLEYFADIDKELIENSTTIISKSNYDLSSVKYGNVAVSYKNFEPRMKVSDNISLQIWFNIHNYMRDEIYNFIHFYDEENNKGYKSHLVNDKIVVKLNEAIYNFELNSLEEGDDPISLEENVWYCYVLNIDQRQREMSQFIYKRDVDYEEDASRLPSNKLRKVYQDSQEIEPISYIIEDNNVNPKIIASDMKATNIRMFSQIIPEEVHNKVLNQYIIGDDSKYLIFADNATTRLFLNRFPLNE